jgi:hypothetical protein
MIKTLKEYDNGGKIDVYDLVDQTAGDFQKIYACCDYFAKQGKHTIITPSFSGDTIGNQNYISIYASLAGTPFWGKCPDFLVDGVWYEHEGFDESKDFSSHPKKREKTFSKMINRGVKQSDKIIVEDCHIGHRWAKKVLYNRVHFENQNLSEVYIRKPYGLELLYIKGSGQT